MTTQTETIVNDKNDPSPFVDEEDDSSLDAASELFMGLIHKRYVKSVVGAIHGVSSVGALVLGHVVFFAKLTGLWGQETTAATRTGWASTLIYSMFFCNLVSSGIVATFFWNKVQSWKAGTTPNKDLGISARQMQNANRGRGVITLVLHSIYPLAVATLPTSVLNDGRFSAALAALMLGLAVHVYILLKDYFKMLFVIFGAFHVGLAASIVQYGSVGALSASHPDLLDYVELDAAYIILLVQHGFLLYYLHSRKLITKDFLRKNAKQHHVAFVAVFMVRNMVRAWHGWPALPAPMIPQAAFLVAFPFVSFAYFFGKKMIYGFFGAKKPSS